MLPLHTFDPDGGGGGGGGKRTMSDETRRETMVASLEVDRDLERMESKESRMGMGIGGGGRIESKERILRQHVEHAFGYEM